jgi:NADPH2:quinone reductase
MKAIVVEEFGAPDVLRVSELPDPRPGPGEVVVRVRAVGVNPVDAYRRSGRYRNLPALPYTPGSDAAGEVVETGEGVTRWSLGDRVYTDHTASRAYAELQLCREDQIHPLSARLSFGQGAALGVPYATAFRALFQRGSARPGERLLIHGATGGVGLAAVQLACAAGLEITATGGTEDGREEARRQGASQLLDHRSNDHAERLAVAAGEAGFDLILELAANENLAIDLGVLGHRGRIVVIGSRGPIEIDPRAIMGRDADVRGMTLFNTPADDLASIHAALFAGTENGSLRPILARELPLADAPAAHEQVMASGHVGKIILNP